MPHTTALTLLAKTDIGHYILSLVIVVSLLITVASFYSRRKEKLSKENTLQLSKYFASVLSQVIVHSSRFTPSRGLKRSITEFITHKGHLAQLTETSAVKNWHDMYQMLDGANEQLRSIFERVDEEGYASNEAKVKCPALLDKVKSKLAKAEQTVSSANGMRSSEARLHQVRAQNNFEEANRRRTEAEVDGFEPDWTEIYSLLTESNRRIDDAQKVHTEQHSNRYDGPDSSDRQAISPQPALSHAPASHVHSSHSDIHSSHNHDYADGHSGSDSGSDGGDD